MNKTKQPNPGHSEAAKLGCTCPVLDNNHGAGCGKDEKGETRFWRREDCPLHGLVAQVETEKKDSLGDRMKDVYRKTGNLYMIETDKLRCRECYWTGKDAEALKAANPFRVDELTYGCPECREINSLIKVCDEPSCRRDASCGFMQSNGAYRQTCSKHSNFSKNP